MNLDKMTVKRNIDKITIDYAKLGCPSFIAVYIPGSGYQYSAVLPGELENCDISPEDSKFNEFLRTVIGFNKEDYKI